MGGLIEAVGGIVQDELDRIAMRIQHDLKAACPKRTGEAASSIHIEDIGTGSVFGAGRFIGSDNDHLYFADQGNGTGGIPKSGKRKVMPISGGRGQWIAFRTGPFNNYEGKHFVRDVADKYR